MVVGVIMVDVALGEERYVYEKLLTLNEVREVYHTFGKYDFLIVIEVEGLLALSSSVDTIRAIKGVTSTHTIVGAEL